LGFTYLAAGLTYASIPNRAGPLEGHLAIAKFMPAWYQAFFGELALTGLLGLAVVGVVSDLVAPGAPAWIEWARRLGYLAFVVSAVEGVRLASLIPQMGQWYYCHCTSTEQTAVQVTYSSLPLDPNNVLTFGVAALWVAAVSLAGIRARSLPAALGVLGLVLALIYLVLVAASLREMPLFVLLGPQITGVVGAGWYIWLGWRLASAAAPVEPVAQ